MVRCNLASRKDMCSSAADLGHEQNYSDAIAYEIDLEVQRIIKECYERARKVLTENRDKLDLIANTLLEVETLNANRIKHLVNTASFLKIIIPTMRITSRKTAA